MMGCKNCWKRGPSIDNQTRKEIWQENFLVRQNLKGAQQSEHFWAFQMTGDDCNCTMQRNPPRRYGSLQALDKINCSPHCGFHTRPDAKLPSVCQVHKVVAEPISRCTHRRDVGTETLPTREDKSVGPGRRVQMATAHTPSYQAPTNSFKPCSRYKPPDWERSDGNSKQHRQQSLSKLRKNEEALQQMMLKNNSKKAVGNWGTEYSRSFKDGRSLGTLPRGSRSGPMMASQSHAGGMETPLHTRAYGTETPMAMQRRMSGMATPLPCRRNGYETPSPSTDTPLRAQNS